MVDYLKILVEIYLKQNGIDAEVITTPINDDSENQSKEETA